MKNKKVKKITSSFILIFMILCQMVSIFNPALAVSIGDVVDIISLGECGRDLLYQKDSGVITSVITHYVVYNENGKKHPVYCLDVSVPGVDSEDDSYGVTVGSMEEIANNQAVWRVLINGFPYKTASEMGLDTDGQAFQATKQAIYCVLGQKDPNRFYGSTDVGKRQANKVKELANIGLNGTQTYIDPVITTTATTTSGVDNIESSYISQTFAIDSQVNTKDITIILDTTSAPEGTIITDTSNNQKTNFNKGESFKILVPRANINGEINVNFSVSGQCESYPILMGKAPNELLQDYVLTTDPYILANSRGTMTYKATGKINIQKVSFGDSEITGTKDGEGLKGAVFTIKSKDGTFVTEISTDADGKCVVSGLQPGKYIISEKSAPEYYLKGKETEFEVTIEHDGDSKNVTVNNIPVDIDVNVEKEVDKIEAQANETVIYEIDQIKNLSNVKLDNFTLTDNLPKEVRIQKLETGTYNQDLTYSIEYSTNKKSNIKLQDGLSAKANNVVDFTGVKLAEGEYVTSYSLKFGTVKIGFSNTSKMKVETKVIEGVTNETTFVNNVHVNGYYLDAKTEDSDDAIVKTYENILKIKKVSKEYNQYTNLPAGTPINAVFELLDENEKYITTLNVKDTEELIYKYLETGKTYYLKEISTDSYYVVSDKLIQFTFEENGEVLELTAENDNVNLVPSVKKEGPAEAQKGEVITYDFDNIGNFSNVAVDNFIWGDRLPRQVTLQKVETGTWNEELTYKVQYITNKNTNWKDVGKFKTTENSTIDFTQIELSEGEYVTQFRFVFGTVKAGFTENTAPKVLAKVNENVQDNKIFVNKTYVTATYKETKLQADDECHTVVYTKEDINKEIELPKTGF